MTQWKTIDNTGGRYSISDDGQVFDHKNNRMLALMENGTYLCCNIQYSNKRVLDKVHRLVAEAFCEKPERAYFVEHLDGNRLNNNYSNLKWIEPLVFGVGLNSPRKHEGYVVKIYNTWNCMLSRCYYEKNPYYHNYGNKGGGCFR